MKKSAMTVGILKSISFKLTATLASHPLFNQYFQNISDFKSLTGFEADELLNLLEQSEQEVFDHFVVVGDRLYDKYQPPFVDIIKIIDFASGEINRAVRKRKLISTADNVNKQAEIIKNAIAKAYFFKSLDNVRLLSSQSPENPGSPLTIHLHWLEEIVAYFTGDLKDLPEVNHLKCHFAAWLKKMEYELLLQSTGDDKDAQHARIYLSHRKIHQEFSYILSFVQNSDYVLAFSHWSLLYQAVLELRQNIQNLQLLYKNHEERFFFEYVDEKSDLEEQLYYFLSIRLAKWTLSSKNQQNIDQL
ncbi:MAG: hypothetical protein AB2720_14965, partial [Candidatus Thiodiazotropha taylori]